MRVLKNILWFCLLLIPLLSFGQERKNDFKSISSYNIFENLIGAWCVPDSVAQKNQQLKERIIFKFEYDSLKSHITVYEDISIKNPND
ncbi:MAG: hypothetical protein KDD03_11855, partial [Gelidibacter sp.]|nr:hypothetical protein [Gelidibacter sp.]